MKHTLSSGTVIDYDDAGAGPALVLLHAFPLAASMWRAQRDFLARSCRVIAPNARGFGGSSGFTDAPSLEQLADDLAGLLDALRLPTAVVGGLSMGGYLTLAFARKYPRRLRGLILADTKAEADSAEGKANRNRSIAFAETHSASEVIEQLLPKLVTEATLKQRPEVVAEIRQIAAAQTPAAIIGALKVLRDRPDATDILPGIRVPTLVIVGSDDVLTPPAQAQILATKIPHARLETLAGAGHLANFEQPDGFNAAVEGFMKLLK